MFNLIIVPILVSLCRQVNLIDISDPRRCATETANTTPPGAKIRDFKPNKGSAREVLRPRKRYTMDQIDKKRPPRRPLDILKARYLSKVHIITKVCFESYTDSKVPGVLRCDEYYTQRWYMSIKTRIYINQSTNVYQWKPIFISI